jgi:hypothetical protein
MVNPLVRLTVTGAIPHVLCARIKAKCDVPCNNKLLLWFFVKEAPTSGVICYFLIRAAP